MASVAKDFHRLMKRVGKLTDGQVTIKGIDWDDGDLQRFFILIQPNNGLYKNGTFKFEIKVPGEYPEQPPAVWCHTDIYHPNIDPTEESCGSFDACNSNVCLNLLEHGVWNRSYGLEGAILGLLFLMHNPNLQDPLSPYFEGGDDDESFSENVKMYMAGEQFDDMTFNTGFCVVDGVLIENTNSAAEGARKPETALDETADKQSNTDSDKTSLDINGENKVDENIPQSSSLDGTKMDKVDTVTASGVEANCTNSEADNDHTQVTTDVNANSDDHIKTTESDRTFTKCETLTENADDNNEEKEMNVNDIPEIIVDAYIEFQQHEDTVSLTDACDEKQVELVNLNGEFLLFVHNFDDPDDTDEDEDATKLDQSSDTLQNASISNDSDDLTLLNVKAAAEDQEPDEVNGDNGDNHKTNNHDNNIDELCTTSLLSVARVERQNSDNDSKSVLNQTTCHCGPWSTVKSALSKFFHVFVQHKMYRDIGL